MSNKVDKAEVARVLASAHRKYDPGIVRIVRVVSDDEQDPNEPVKLLEVNPDTSPSGIVPIAFGAFPPEIPFPSVVIEVTDSEYEDIQKGILTLEEGWKLGDTLYQSTT